MSESGFTGCLFLILEMGIYVLNMNKSSINNPVNPLILSILILTIWVSKIDQVGKNAEAKGMTEEKLKEILESDDWAKNCHWH